MKPNYFDDIYDLKFINDNLNSNDLSEGLRTKIKNFLGIKKKNQEDNTKETETKTTRKAGKRMRVLNTAHYTTQENKEKILKHGFNRGSSGVYHPRDSENETIYTTPSSRVGKDYGKSRVNLRVINPKIKSTENRRGFHAKYSQSSESERKSLRPPQEHSKELIKKGEKIVRIPDAHHTNVKGSYIMVNRDTANKSIVSKRQPTMRANKPRKSSIKTLSSKLKENHQNIELYNNVLEYLINENFCSNIEDAKIIFDNMGDFCSRSRSWKGPRGLPARRRWKC